MSLDTSSHIGNYRLAQQLGAGGMGIVYRAEDESLGREVAIKVLHPHLLKNKEHKERFRREARVHAKLMHPNIVTLLALHEEDDQMALIMEMVHGKNLKEYLKQEDNHAIVDLIQIALSILAGLEAAHQIGLIHRDLKPANVLIANTGEVKLMDFGLAKSTTGEDDLTKTGATVGSFRYMAPEQITNQDLDQRTDIYAFGILLYQMVTGHLPFNATAAEGGEFAIMEKQVRELPQLPHEINPEIPLALSDLILRMMAKNPNERPKNCDDVRQGLQAVLQNLSNKASAPSFARFTESATKYFELDMKSGDKKWPHLKKNPKTILAIGILLLLSVVIWFVFYDNKTPVSSVTTEQHPPTIHTAIVHPPLIEPYQETVKPSLEDKKQEEKTQNAVKEDKKIKKEPEKKVATTVSTPHVNKPKPVKKEVLKPKPIVKKQTLRPIEKNILERVAYKVRRQNGEKVDVLQAHEFHNGTHTYFGKLPRIQNKTFFTTFKRGGVRLYFYEPIHLKAIVIEKASVQGALFDGNKIKLEVQDGHFKWYTLLNLTKHDISKPMRIAEKSLPASIKSVRIRLTSSSPLLLGPIRLLE